MQLEQYQVVLVNLDPTIGSEIKKTRPCVVISPNEMNRHLQTIVIVPITSTSKPYPTRIELKDAKTSGWIVIDQVRTIDRLRVRNVIEQLNEKIITVIKAVIKETFVEN